jgi:hypothetical protein
VDLFGRKDFCAATFCVLRPKFLPVGNSGPESRTDDTTIAGGSSKAARPLSDTRKFLLFLKVSELIYLLQGRNPEGSLIQW